MFFINKIFLIVNIMMFPQQNSKYFHPHLTQVNLFLKLKSIPLIRALDEALSILSAPRNPKKLTRQLSLPNDKANLEGRSNFQQFGTFLAPPKSNKRNVGLFRKGIRYLYQSVKISHWKIEMLTSLIPNAKSREVQNSKD